MTTENPNLPQDVADLLQQVRRPGDFYAAGTAEIHAPRLEVEGVGAISLPLLPVQAEQLVAIADRSPYGRGSETLVDTEVRRTWQVDADRVHIAGRHWARELGQIVDRVTAGLGVAGTVEAELYKLLVYDTGSFFVTHRDTEKTPGMFGTLVLVLPCDYRGGELVVRHRGREVRLSLQPSDPAEVAYAAFYADCRHEVLPIAEGYRLALIYNLVRRGAGPVPAPPDYAQTQEQITALLRAWAERTAGADDPPAPDKLVYPLEHAYTLAELGFDALKGADAAVARVLAAAALAADCDHYLSLLTIRESGWAEQVGDWDDDDAFEIGEVEDQSETLHDWRHPDGSRPSMGPLPFFGDELCPPDAVEDFDDLDPDFQEATGNEGASFQRFYQRAALILWPRSNRAKVVAAGGLDVGVPLLGELVRQWEAAPNGAQGGTPNETPNETHAATPGANAKAADSPLRQEALELAARLRRAWPTDDRDLARANQSGHAAALLEALARLGDLEQRAAFLAEQAAAGAYAPTDNPTLAQTLRELPPDRAGGLLAALVAKNGPRIPGACAELLALCSQSPSLPAETLHPAAEALLEVLPRGEPHAEQGRFHRYPRFLAVEDRPAAGLVTATLTALERIDPLLAGRALEQFLGLPEVYPMDDLLLQAALQLREDGADNTPSSFSALRRAVLAHLERRIAEPLRAPTDWARPAEVACTCTYCADLNRFLAAPDREVWRLKAAERHRQHVTGSITRHRCDLYLATERQGTPHTLVCTKNQASHERRTKQRERDLEHRALLGG